MIETLPFVVGVCVGGSGEDKICFKCKNKEEREESSLHPSLQQLQ